MYFFITFVFLNGFLNNITQIAGYLFNTIFQTKEKSYLCSHIIKLKQQYYTMLIALLVNFNSFMRSPTNQFFMGTQEMPTDATTIVP